MTEHLFDHVRPLLEEGQDKRITFIKSERWIGYKIALDHVKSLDELFESNRCRRPKGLLLVGPYANGKTVIAERFALEQKQRSNLQKVWVIQTKEGAGLLHFYKSILSSIKAPTPRSKELFINERQLNTIIEQNLPKIIIFDEFHNALRGRRSDIQNIFACIRRLGHDYGISCVLVGDVTVYDWIHDSDEMASRFDECAVPRWHYDEEYLSLLDSLEATFPLLHPSDLSEERLARPIFNLSEGLIGEIVNIVTKAAISAIIDGSEMIKPRTIDALEYVPLSMRRKPARRERLI